MCRVIRGKSQIPIPKSQIHTRTRSPTGRGACFRNKKLKVRILPRVPIWELGIRTWNLPSLVVDLGTRQRRNPTSAFPNPKSMGGYSQAIKAADCRSAHHRFKSDYPLHTPFCSECESDYMANQVKRLLSWARVAGSNPAASLPFLSLLF